MKQAFPFLIIILFLSSCINNDNQKTSNFLSNKWEILFDGASLDNWRGFKQESLPDGWVIKDGNLVALGQGGDLGGDIISQKQYEDFELELEWAISEGGNSGIFFHVLENGYPTVYATGPEYQLIDDEGFPQKLEEWQKTGANYAMHKANHVVLNAIGKFNKSRIKVLDGHVEQWLNGLLVVKYDLWTDDWKLKVQNSKWKEYPGYGLALKGHIGLQDHGSMVKFRNIRIRDLTDIGESLFNGKNLDGWKIYGTEKWYVENGELICESGPDKQYGYLATKEGFKNFILKVKIQAGIEWQQRYIFQIVN